MMATELVELPGGSFRMGSVDFYPEEAPIHTATVAAFAIERHPVTNAQFAEFVAETGYVTVAEKPLDPALYPGVAEEDLLPGALVFRPTRRPRRPAGLAAVVGLGARGVLAPAVRCRQRCHRPGGPPGGAGRLPRRGGICGVGGPAAADRGRVRVRGTGRK